LVFERLFELVRTFTQFAEQARVLHCDDRLRRKILEKRDLPLGERPYLLTVDRKYPKQAIVFEQRHTNRAAGTAEVYQSPPQGFARPVDLLGCDVGADNKTFPTQQAAERVLGMRPLGRASVFGEGPRYAAKAGGMKAFAVVLPKDAEIGRTKAGRLFEHRIEHRGELAG